MTPDVKWDVVIGDNLQRIHERFEIDIPAVLIDRETGRARRVAIEVDSARTHSSMEVRDQDARKDSSLKRAGRQVVRVNGDCVRKKSALAEAVADLALFIEGIAGKKFACGISPGGPSMTADMTGLQRPTPAADEHRHLGLVDLAPGDG